jgi:hypothetical protein
LIVAVRKRTWTTKRGERRSAWLVDYADQAGARHIATFARKKDADAYDAEVRTAVRAGIHTAPSRSPTVAEAAQSWLAYVQLEGASDRRWHTTARTLRITSSPGLGVNGSLH